MTEADTAFVVSLHDGDDHGADVMGTKAATLARLAASGFRVPEGFVVTTSACDRILATLGGLGRSPIGADLPEDVWAEVISGLDQLGSRSLAVRSSGSAEDLSDASYAGQYTTMLDVEGPDAVAAAIAGCLASGSSDQVRAYKGSAGRAPMAVLIQRMVPARAAGVAFTANPVTGDPEVLVSAVTGIGERLVSGQATPDEWVVRGSEATCVRSAEEALGPDEAREIAALAKSIERTFGSPQDVEWAVAADQVFVLQARPITALPVAPEIEIPTEGFWLKDTSHFPTPFTPFGASVYLPALSGVSGPLADEFGLLLEGFEARSLGGEVYMRMIPLGGRDRRPPPSWAMWLAARLAPPIRRRARAAHVAVESRLPERILVRWENEWRPAFAEEIGALRGIDLGRLDDQALLAHLDRLKDLLGRGAHLHFRLHAPHSMAVYQLGEICHELLGWDVTRALHLLTGTSVASSEPGRELRALAVRFAADPTILELITTPGGDRLGALREVAPWAAKEFEEYLERYGHRTVGYDPGDPTLFERPEMVLGLLAEQMRDSVAAGAATPPVLPEAVAQARVELAGRGEEDQARFEQALAYAQRAYGQREDNISWLDNQPCALLRYSAIEIGRRLTERHILAHPNDAVFLDEEELRMALTGSTGDVRHVVVRRKAERAWVVTHPGPDSYGRDPGPPPDLSPLPPALRMANAALANLMQLIMGPTTPQDTTDSLRGVPASPGLYSGTVRVVRDETEFAKLLPGDVLVAPATSPPWSILFLQAGAVVTDGGGVLSHTAVIAREYGIPAVLATGEATRRLCDGDLVTVDGSSGLVSLGGAN